MKKKQLLKYVQDIIIVLFSVSVFIFLIFSLYKIIITTAPDFPSYYIATIDLLHKVNPYLDKDIPNIFIYPSATSIIYLPLISLPYTVAQGIFVILSALCVPIIVYISLKLVYKKFSWRHVLIYSALAYLSFPTKFTLGMGQVNLIALLFLMIGFYLYRKERILSTSILVGVSILAKPILSFVLLFFIINKAWRTIVSIIMTLIILFFFSFIMYGIQHEVYYITTIVPTLVSGTEGREVYYNQGIMGFISRLTEDDSIRKYSSLFLSLFLIGFTIYVIKKYRVDINSQFALFLTLLPIVHTLSWQHYFVILIFPFIHASRFLLEKKSYKLFILLLLSYLLISWNIKDSLELFNFPLSLLLSHTLYGGFLLFFVQIKLLKLNRKN